MAWSYRNDRADEIYTTAGGPALAETTPIQPPVDEEGPPVEEGGELPPQEVRDPQAGRKVLTPEERLRQESKLVNTSADLEAERVKGMERNRIRMEERQKLQDEERGKEEEKTRKEVAEQVKKEESDREKTEREKTKPQPTAFGAGPR